MIIVGVCGASGSGKSTLAQEIANSLNCTTRVIGQDCYYKDHSHLPFEERKKINYDSPLIFEHDELLNDAIQLQNGMAVTKKGYDYKLHIRADSDELITPPDVLILEGIHMFHDPRLVRLMSLKLYMHVDVDECLLRRIERDRIERKRTFEEIALQYRQTVKPMYDEYVSKYIRVADFAVMKGGKNKPAIDAISAYLTAKLLSERISNGAEEQ